MKEELIISGRMNPHIDPILNAWGWEIAFYLFVGGLSAGILFFSALFVLRKKENIYPTAVKLAPMFVPFFLILGLGALFIDLHHKIYFWRLYTTVRLQSPMSWGAWTLMIITPLSIAWAASFVKEIWPKFNWWNIKLLNTIEKIIIDNRRLLAWPLIIYSVILGIYTGILLSAFNARPLWNTSILGPLFLTSGLSTAAALIVWMSKSKLERNIFTKIDLLLIGIELFLITHLIMGFLAGGQVQVESAQIFLGGAFTTYFWVFLVMLGLILPAILEILELNDLHIPAFAPAILILAGGIIFRFLIVEAGQITRYLY
ncbi:MAG: polysulfide reductase NrfD [Bacteroidales bacterium]|jgi:protein NrfD|nr:polysulfide reductase NrfD [Bacteroidales bacterium]